MRATKVVQCTAKCFQREDLALPNSMAPSWISSVHTMYYIKPL